MYKKIINRLSKEENIFRWIFFWRTYFEKSNSRVHYIIGKGSHGSALGNFPLNEHKPFLQTFFPKVKKKFSCFKPQGRKFISTFCFQVSNFLSQTIKAARIIQSMEMSKTTFENYSIQIQIQFLYFITYAILRFFFETSNTNLS
jgi:hypothetical protein